MHNKLFTILSTLALTGAVGCSSSTPEPQTPATAASAMALDLRGAPNWVGDCMSHPSVGDGVCGVGDVSGMTNVSLARTAAVARGRANIAATVQAEVARMINDRQRETVSDGMARSDIDIEVMAKEIVTGNLSGSAKKAEWVSNGGTFYALVVIDSNATQRDQEKMQDVVNDRITDTRDDTEKAKDELRQETAGD